MIGRSNSPTGVYTKILALNFFFWIGWFITAIYSDFYATGDHMKVKESATIVTSDKALILGGNLHMTLRNVERNVKEFYTHEGVYKEVVRNQQQVAIPSGDCGIIYLVRVFAL